MKFQPLGGPTKASLSSIITGLGLTTSLQLCLDAGDSSSYSGSGQFWSDRSGNGYDFTRGASSSSGSDDPTFNGSAGGLSLSEYWSGDGGDYFEYEAANATWMTNYHKNNAALTMFAVIHIPSGNVASVPLAGTSGGTFSGVGFLWVVTGGFPLMRYSISNANGSSTQQYNGSTAVPTGKWVVLATSFDEAAATGFHYISGASEAISGAYSSPSSASATGIMQIASTGTDNSIVPSQTRFAMFAAWSSALSTANVQALHNAVRGRFGV